MYDMAENNAKAKFTEVSLRWYQGKKYYISENFSVFRKPLFRGFKRSTFTYQYKNSVNNFQIWQNLPFFILDFRLRFPDSALNHAF